MVVILLVFQIPDVRGNGINCLNECTIVRKNMNNNETEILRGDF